MGQMDLMTGEVPASDIPIPHALASLGLTMEDLAALARGGFVAAEFRHLAGPYYKLRWRRDRQQHVRYLGRDPARAVAVRAALEDLQQPLRLSRELARRVKEARRRLQGVKQMLASHLAGHGIHYHGYMSRQCGRQGEEAASSKSIGDKGRGLCTPSSTVGLEGTRHG